MNGFAKIRVHLLTLFLVGFNLTFASCTTKVEFTDLEATSISDGTHKIDNVTLDIQDVSSGVSLTEGSSIVLIVSQSDERENLTSAKIEISAVSNNANLSSVFGATSFNLQIPAHSKTGSLAINTVHNTSYTGNQRFLLTLRSDDSKVTTKKNQIEVTINDAESAPVIKFLPTTQSISEAAGTGSATISMNRAASFPVTVDYIFIDHSAVNGTDYNGSSGSLTLAAGETSKTLSFSVTDNAIPGATKDFSLQLNSVTSPVTISSTENSQTVSILDNDTAILSVSGGTVTEGSNLVFTVTLSPASTQSVTVDYATSNGTAMAGTHYISQSGTLTFAAGETSKTINVVTNSNPSEICATDKTFSLQLSNPVHAGIGTNSATGTITDPDIPTINISDASGTEGGNVVFTATLNAACATKSISFNWATSSGTAISNTDFGAVNTTATITAGNTSVSLPVTTIQNSNYNGDITFSIALSSLTNVNAGTQTTATGTIHDDEVPLGSFSISGISAASGDSTLDAYLVNANSPKVNWGSSTNATSYDVTIFNSAGSSVVCATQNTTSTSFDFAGTGSCTLTTNTDYKAEVVAKLGSQTLNASNSKYTFHVNASPEVGSGGNGPWYVMQGGSITINAAWAASPSVGIASDPESDGFSITAVGTANLGSVTNNSSNIVYTAGASSSGKDTFSLTITDSKGGTLNTTMTIHVMTIYTWTGGSSNIWNSSTASNWCGSINTNKNGCTGTGSVPGASATAIIDNTCVGINCSPTTNYNVSVQGLKINGSQLNQGTGYTLTVGTEGLTQTAGTFVGSNSTISLGGGFSLSGGDFTSTSGNLSITANNTLTISGSNLFHHNSGTLYYGASYGIYTLNANSADFNNVTFTGANSAFTLSSPIIVNGTLTFADTYNGVSTGVNGSSIYAKGNITLSSFGFTGTTTVYVSGSGNQTITGTGSGAYIPNVTITSTGGVVTLSNKIYTNKNFIYSSGSVDFSTSTISFLNSSSQTIDANGLSFYNLTLGGSGNVITFSNPVNVTGVLTLNDVYTSGAINGSTINLYGNLTASSGGKSGTTIIKIMGNSSQSITGASGANFPVLNIASTGGTVSMNGTIQTDRTFTYTSGTVDFGTSSVIFSSNSNQTIDANDLSFYNLTLGGSGNTAITLSNPFNVTGTLTLNGTYGAGSVNGASINLYGHLVTSNYGKAGTSVINVVGNTNQTITGLSGGANILSLNIASTGGTVSFASNINMDRNFTYTSGTVDFGTSGLTFYSTITQTINANGLNFYNLTLAGSNTTINISNPFNVLGTLTLNGTYGAGSVNGSSINIYGNVVTTNSGKSGSTLLSMLGTTNTSLSCASGAVFPGSTFYIKKSDGYKVTQTSACSFSTSGQNFTVQSGEHNMGGNNLTVNNYLTVNAGATLNAAAGTYSPNSGAKYSCLGTCNP